MPSSMCCNVALGLGLLVHLADGAASVARGGSSSFSAGSAALAACLPSAPNKISLAKMSSHQRLRGKEAAFLSAGTAEGAAASTQMLDSISAEILALQEELDDSHLACEADKRVAEKKISMLTNSNSQVAQDVGSLEAKIAYSSGQLQPTTEKIQNLRDEIQKMRTYCEKEGKALNKTDGPQLIRVMKATRLETQCRGSVRTMNDQLLEKVGHLGKVQVALTQVVAMKTQYQQQMKEADQHMNRLMKALEEKNRDCKEGSEQFQREMCGLVEMRQAIYWKFVNQDPNTVLEDCKVSDWTAGQCSKSCMDSTHAEPGTMTLTRTTLVNNGEYGAACPALARNVKCNEGVLCKVDCQMAEWSGWAKCSRKCAGGEQYRTRSVVRPAEAGGAVCGVTAESQQCNVGRCQPSCTLGEWSPWGPCSKRCKWKGKAAGHASRKRPVLMETKPGSCKEEDTRELQKCNQQRCPTSSEALKCTQPQDVLMVLDGSDKVKSDDGSAFDSAKGFLSQLVQHSSFSGDGSLLRYALMLFGASRPQVLAPMTGDKNAVLEALQSASFQGGWSNVAEAMSTAVQVSQLATSGERPLRRETLLLVTGNKLRKSVATATAARRLRAVGVRIIVLQVGEIDDPVVQGDESVCQMASAPCADNWLRVESWEKLSEQEDLGYYLSTICPLSGA